MAAAATSGTLIPRMTASVRLATTEEPWTRFPARSSGASSVRVAAIVRPSALATPAVKPSSASLRSGRRSHATATGNSMNNWPVAGTATADASTPPFVSDVASLGTSESATTGPSSSAHAAPSAAPARNMTVAGTAKRASHGAISYR